MMAVKHQRHSVDVDVVERARAAHKRRGQLVLDLGHVPSHAEADFIVGASNALAFDHIAAFAGWPAPLTLVTGPAKSGKSHLGRIWVERSGAFIACANDLEYLASAEQTRPVLLEDADRSPYDEKALFHLLNQSMRDVRPLLMTARDPVAEWPYKTDDLKSRVRLAARFAVDAPDDMQLAQMFVKLFDDRQIAVDPKIIAYLVARMERSAEEVVKLVALMDDLALAQRRPITRSVAAEALGIRNVAHAALRDGRGES